MIGAIACSVERTANSGDKIENITAFPGVGKRYCYYLAICYNCTILLKNDSVLQFYVVLVDVIDV
jgi:hypothetical protein